ncbi:AAA family ATPase [Shigella flexneri]|mgnify:FL=1
MNNIIVEKSEDIKYINETLSQMLAKKALLEKEYNALKSEVSLSMVRVSWQPDVKEFLDYLQWQEHEKSVGAYEKLLSAFMEEVLPGYRKVVFELTTERNAPALNIFIKKGEDMPPEDALMGTGGSVTNILVTGLRIISLLRSGKRKFLVLDEPDCWLNPDYIPAFSKVINEMAKELGIQIFLISHYVNSTFSGIDHTVHLYKNGNRLDTNILGEIPIWEDGEEGIKSIMLRDFQAHTDTYIPLSPGVTLLTGDNDIGKSAIVTALRSIFYGKGNKTNIRHFCDKASVSIEFTGNRLLCWERNNKGKYKESYVMLDENHDIDNPLHRNDGASLPDWLMEETGIGLIDGLDIQLAWQKEPLSLLGEAPPMRAKALAVGSEADYVQGMMGLSKEDFNDAKASVKQGEKKLESWRVQLEYLKDIGKLKQNYDLINEEIQGSQENIKKIQRVKELISKIEVLSNKKEDFSPLSLINSESINDKLSKMNPQLLENMKRLYISWNKSLNRYNSLKIIEKTPIISKIEEPKSLYLKNFASRWIKLSKDVERLSPLKNINSNIRIELNENLPRMLNLKETWEDLLNRKGNYAPLFNIKEIEIPSFKDDRKVKELLKVWKESILKQDQLNDEISNLSEEIKKTSDTIKNEFPVCPTCERPWDNHKEEHSTKNIKKVEKQIIVEENKIEKAEAFKVKRRTI